MIIFTKPERIRDKWLWVISKHYSNICLDRPRINTSSSARIVYGPAEF
jgi:hypothetical protein